jgi:hypothetical protein
MSRHNYRAVPGLAIVAGATLLAGALPAAAETNLASRSIDGRFPNAPSLHPALSQDRKAASLLAYDSAASDIVAGDSNGFGDVFVVHRASPFKASAKKATAWRPGSTELVSTGMGGQPANGASFAPDLDGDQLHSAHCVAFLSDATNLVPDDTNARTDAFVKDLDSGQITRVSVNTAGAQADGGSYDVQVDGACDRVAFTSDASNLALTRDQLPKPRRVRRPLTGAQRQRCRQRFKGNRPAQKKRCKFRNARVASQRAPAVTTAPAPGTRQVYVRVLGGQPDDAGLEGTTFLASASRTGTAGDGNSFDAAFGDLGASCPKSCGTTSGDAVAFTSESTNLTGGDGNGASDVFLRTFRIPTQHFQDRRAKIPAYMKPATVLVSATSGGSAGNGASDQPAVSGNGESVAFRSSATNLFSGDANGVTDVLYADLSRGRPKLQPMSFTSAGKRHGNGPSSNPALSRNGSPALFQTDADNLSASPVADRNCAADALLWLLPKRRLSIQSLTAGDAVVGNPPNPAADPCPQPTGAPGVNDPALSWLANYAAFEHAGAVAGSPDSGADPHQVFVHFVGP